MMDNPLTPKRRGMSHKLPMKQTPHLVVLCPVKRTEVKVSHACFSCDKLRAVSMGSHIVCRGEGK